MADPKPRRWFQIHLSTVLLILVVGGAFWGLFVTTFRDVGVAVEGLGSWPGDRLFERDFLIAAGSSALLLGLLAVFCEYSIRRREVRGGQGIRLRGNTVLALMVVAGGLLWANFRERIVITGIDSSMREEHGCGFPLIFRKLFELNVLGEFRNCRGFDSWQPQGIIVDVLVAGGLLVLTALACEWLIRRREHKP